MIRIIVRLIAAILVAAAAAYPIADLLREPLGPAEQAQLLKDGKAEKFLPLSQGVTHIRQFGPENGTPVIVVHGLSNGGYIFEDVAAPLAAEGFRIIAIDRYGYGYSDRPQVPYTNDFFIDQIKETIVALGITRPVHLLGYSQGGAIVTGFAARERASVQSVVLLAPAGLDNMQMPPAYLSSPVIGEWLFRVLGPEISRRQVEPTFANSAHPERLVSAFREQIRFRGYGEGLLSTARHFDWVRTLVDYDRLGASNLPVLAIWGTADTILPYSQSKSLVRRVPQTKLVTLHGKEHNLGYTDTAGVAAVLLPFLQEQETRFNSIPTPASNSNK